MGYVTHEANLAPGVAPLTKEEIAWVRSLERVLRKMPRRLLLIEIGDQIEIVDREAGSRVPLEDGNAIRNGVMLGSVDHSTGVLTGVSG